MAPRSSNTSQSFVLYLAAAVVVALALAAAVPAASGQACYPTTSLNFTSEQGGLFLNGQRFRLKGTSWFGFETRNNVVHGLWSNTIDFYLDFLVANRFNAIRLPFHLGIALNDAYPSSGDLGPNPQLFGLSSLAIMDKIIQGAANRGIVIMLDLHSFTPDSFQSDSLWYNGQFPESTVIDGWVKILTRYRSQWNVIAADLKNEPHSGTWGTGNLATDWDKGAARLANSIHSRVSPRFLVFVEGVANSPSTRENCFWGENLAGVRSNPVNINFPEKLVYSPHVYGPQVFGQAYFSAGNFPANMPAIWDDHFGYVKTLTGKAVVIGEWGGMATGQNGVWATAMQAYLVARDMTDQFFWCLNPNSGDTGGLLDNDWKSPVSSKLSLLANLVTAPTSLVVSNAQVCLNGATGPAPAASPSSAPASPSSAPASPSSAPAAPSRAPPAASPPVTEPTQAAAPSPAPAAPSASASPAAASPAAKPPTGPVGGFVYYAGSSDWWFAVTVANSQSASVDCGNGQGMQPMMAGWMPNMWVFTSTNGQKCASTHSYKINGGGPVAVTVPW